MSDKVKLPKEICEYIEDLLIGSTKEDFLAGVLGSANSPKFEAIKKHFKNDFDALLQALVIGWEVEQTPEDKVRELYDNPPEYIIQKTPYARGITDTLNTLNIKIPGINT